jgi:hypothetical protein
MLCRDRTRTLPEIVPGSGDDPGCRDLNIVMVI